MKYNKENILHKSFKSITMDAIHILFRQYIMRAPK